MKHIYLINNMFRGSAYGIGTYIRELICCIRDEQKYQISIIELHAQTNVFKIHTDKKNHVRRISIPEPSNITSEKDLKRYYRNCFYLLVPYVSSSEQNVFHFNYQRSPLLITLLKNRWPNCTTVLTLHYQTWCFNLKGNTTKFRHILNKAKDERTESENQLYTDFLFEKEFLNKIDKIICLSIYTKNILCLDFGISEQKISIIYNGLKEKKPVWSLKTKNIKKKQLLFSPDERIILFVGRLDEIKGVEYLIKAFKQILKKIPDSRLVIVGEGQYDFYLKDCIGIWNKLTFTGKLEQKKLYELYQIADVGVMPSFHEQCSYVAIEMMMYGLPIIGTDSTGLKEMLARNHQYMIKIQETTEQVTLSVDTLYQNLLSLLEEKNSQIKARQNSRTDFEEKYSLSIMKESMNHFYFNI